MLLVVNKVDGMEREDMMLAEFHALGFPLMAVSAEHGHNVRGLEEEIRALLLKYGAPKLSGIDPKHYEALLKDVEGLTGTPKGPNDLLGKGGAAE